MNITLDDIELPGDLFWSDETTPWKVAQTVTLTLTGAIVVQEAAMQAGRPVTLECLRDSAGFVGVSRAIVDALLAKEAVAGAAAMTLVIPRHDASPLSMQVRWRRTDGPAIEATPIRFMAPIASGDWYSLTLRLMQV